MTRVAPSATFRPLTYPTWHERFNRVPGLAEVLVPGREDACRGSFLRQSAGPNPLSNDPMHAPLAIPVLTVAGESGMGRGVADCFASVANRVEPRQIGGAGHYPAKRRPVEVNGHITPFLDHHLKDAGVG